MGNIQANTCENKVNIIPQRAQPIFNACVNSSIGMAGRAYNGNLEQLYMAWNQTEKTTNLAGLSKNVAAIQIPADDLLFQVGSHLSPTMCSSEITMLHGRSIPNKSAQIFSSGMSGRQADALACF